MQLPPAGPEHPDLPHTQARPVHWIVTAAALGAALGAAALAQPSDATASPGSRAAGAPEAAEAAYPVDCGPYDVLVTDEAAVDLDDDGRAETVAAVRCDAGGGTPPSGLYVLAAPPEPGAPPRVAGTLVDPAERMIVDRLSAGRGSVSARLLGYSSPDVPRTAPDLRREVTWQWRDGRLRLEAEPATATSA
ncbi:hypothetical protein [Streptomyces sp. 6N223]|uniref:hypothetical protein n=1 Tax=Streptomyces sp. 6N223 TaxID=3457412 RepID=UPI003FD3FD48